MAALALICCGGPLLVAAVGAGGVSLVVAWLQPNRVLLLAATAVLFAAGAYVSRRRRTPSCDVNDGGGAITGRRPALILWTGAALALLAAFLSWW